MVTMTMWLDVCRFSFSTLPVFNFGVLTLGFARCTGEIAKCNSIDIYILFSFVMYLTFFFLVGRDSVLASYQYKGDYKTMKVSFTISISQNSQNQLVKLLCFSFKSKT